jgi:uncharacterized protein
MDSPCTRHGCAACCFDTEMPLTEDDITRLAALGHPRDAFVAWSDEGSAQLNTVEPSAAGAPRPCFFLRDGRCSVYAHRPAGCRIYPLVLNERRRIERDADCPHGVEFLLDPAAKRRIERILARVARRP